MSVPFSALSWRAYGVLIGYGTERELIAGFHATDGNERHIWFQVTDSDGNVATDDRVILGTMLSGRWGRGRKAELQRLPSNSKVAGTLGAYSLA